MAGVSRGAGRGNGRGTDSEEAAASEIALTARICWHYFSEGQTQDVIAQRLGITRKRVNRLLGEARESGLVRVTIASSVPAYPALETRLVEQYGLRRAIVVPSTASGTDVRVVVGAAAGQYISENLSPQGYLGITWGGTIRAAAETVVPRSGQGNSVVSLCGGLARSTRVNPYDNAAMMARALDAACYYVTAPMFSATSELRDAFVASEPIAEVLTMAARLDMALLSAVDLTEHSKALEYGVISSDLWQSLRKAGAVGDICGHYLDADGRCVQHPITGRIIHPRIETIQRIPHLVLAAGGDQKVPIIRAAMRAGLCHVLITDESAARSLAN